MTNGNLDRLRAHQANIGHYRGLLATRLSKLERAYIERRPKDEKAYLKALFQETFPDRLAMGTQKTDAEIASLLNPAIRSLIQWMSSRTAI